MPNNYSAVNCDAPSLTYQVKLPMQPVPTDTTAIINYDVDLLCLSVCNTSNVAISFTMADQQSSPQTLVSLNVLATSMVDIVAQFGIYMYGGFTVIASAEGLVFQARWTQGGQSIAPSVLLWDSAPGNWDDLGGVFDNPVVP
jgi:hypothetical protein